MDTERQEIIGAVRDIAKGLKTIAEILTTGATVEGKRSDAAKDEDDDFKPAKGKKAKPPEDDGGGEEQTKIIGNHLALVDQGRAGSSYAINDRLESKLARGKAKRLTVDDCNDAAKARAARTGGKEGRNEVLALLKKHFKTSSISEVKPEQYQKLIEVMEAE